MGKVIDIVIILFVGFFLVTQVIIPIVFGWPLFWIFMKAKPKVETKESPDLKKSVQDVKQQYKEVKTEVDSNLDDATKIKNDLDNLND